MHMVYKCQNCDKEFELSLSELICPYCNHSYEKHRKVWERIFEDREIAIELSKDPASKNLWEKWWKRKSEGSLGWDALIFGIYVNEDHIERWKEARFDTILFVGNGVSQDPRTCSSAGFNVTVIDISKFATKFASSFPYMKYEQEHFHKMAKYKTSGGHLKFVTDNFIETKRLSTKYDVVVCCNTLQYYENDLLRRACRRLVDLLNPNGFLLLSGTNADRKSDEIRDIFIEEGITFVKSRLIGNHPNGKTAQMIRVTG